MSDRSRPGPRTYRFTLEYDGTHFEGWQRQVPGHRTVQETLEMALGRILGGEPRVIGAGRTDAGVHAEGQVASAPLEVHLDPAALGRALNALLPGDLAVVHLEIAPDGFHARRAARSKLYHYRIWNGPQRSPLRERRAHGLRAPLDVEAMQRAAEHLRGTHDFASFQAAGSGVRNSVRTLLCCDVRGRAGGELCIEVEGTGFLRHMVRTLAGTLLEVGRGRRAPDSMPGLLAARARRAAGPTAPARGLTLVRVDYPEPVS